MKEKFVKKYMRMAKQVGEDMNPCYSRSIGVIVVRNHGDGSGKVLGTGYNGPPRNTPHCDDREYLAQIVWPQLTEQEKLLANHKAGVKPDHEYTDEQLCENFANTLAGCKTCPRKIVGAPSGKRLELCSCAHAETNAIVNASDDLYGAEMFCWCGCPCYECTKLIINSGIKKVYIIDWGADYSHGSRFLFHKAGVVVEEHKPEYYLEE
jgi:deoxycytidylate deaminase